MTLRTMTAALLQAHGAVVCRRFIPVAALVAICPLAAPAFGALADDHPPPGRYRCYTPPSYTVKKWFDLEANGTYHPQRMSSGRYRYDPATRVLRWLDGEYAETGLVGFYVPPRAGGETADRFAIVMTPPGNLKPPRNDRDRRTQCLLITH